MGGNHSWHGPRLHHMNMIPCTTVLSGAALGPRRRRPVPDLAPAGADTVQVSDPRDLDHGVDLRSVSVRHTARAIVVTTTHTDLRPSYRTGSSGTVFLDTDPTDTGPEYVFAGGYFGGTDYMLLEHRRFRQQEVDRAGRGVLPHEGRLRHRPGADADLPRRPGLAGAGARRRARRRHPARRQQHRGATGSASRAASPSGSPPPSRDAYLISRTSCGHPQPSATLAAHSFASSRVATSMTVMPPRCSVVSV